MLVFRSTLCDISNRATVILNDSDRYMDVAYQCNAGAIAEGSSVTWWSTRQK